MLGILNLRPSAEPSGWAAAVRNLAVRSGPWQSTASFESGSTAFRSRDSGRYFENDSYIVMLDGFVEASAGAQPAEARWSLDTPASLIAHLYIYNGIESLASLRGHFAVAILDIAQGQVSLLCDCVGTRSLFYTETRDGWAWASSVKSLAPLLERRALDFAGLAEACHQRWLTGENTLLEGIRQVLPSHWVRLRAGKSPEMGRHTVLRFRPAREHPGRDALIACVDGSLDRYFANLRRRHGTIGILLSGGVDSSLLAAKACEHGFDRIVAVTVRFPGHDNPEMGRAERVAKRLGLDLRVVDVPDAFVAESFPAFIWRMEELPRHVNGIALAKVFAEIAQDVCVVVSGEGADNMFGPEELLELDRFEHRRLRRTSLFPRPLRNAIGRLLPMNGNSRWRALGDQFRYTARDAMFWMSGADRNVRTPLYRAIEGVPRRPAPSPGLLALMDPESDLHTAFQELDLYTVNRSNAIKYDKLATPHNISVEMPFLLHDAMAIGMQLPAALKAEGREAKPLLKEICARYFPREWVLAPKLAFSGPVSAWLRGPLARWVAALQQERGVRRGLYHLDVIGRLDPERDAATLWTAAALEMFLRLFVDGDGAEAE
ncbi:MAG: asparagine synthase-related protein [Bryobacteraceae bacterium]|jgi:asparagine synthase (glutamine-hydrolysing)